MSDLTLAVKTVYFDQIAAGIKGEEYRLVNDYWIKRLANREYDRVVITKGYPKADDTEKRLVFPWRGCRIISIHHEHFTDGLPVEVFAISLSDWGHLV